MNKSLLAITTMIGTIIGAGTFAIPYVFAQSGLITCLFYFLLVGVLAILLHLFFGEIVLRAKKEKRLIGYTKEYLGNKQKWIVQVALIIGTVGSLLVYIILLGKFLGIIFQNSLSDFQFSIIGWMVLSLMVLFGAKSVALVNFLMSVALVLAAGVIMVFCLPKIQSSSLVLFNIHNLFLPFGIFLFSLVGWSAITEAEDLLIDKKKLKNVILGSLIFCIIFYILFGLSIAGVSGVSTTPEAFEGLSAYFGWALMLLAGIFGFLAVATSFLTLSNYLRNTLILDIKIDPVVSFLLVCFIPFLFFVFGLRQFIEVVSILGGFIGLIEGVAIILIWLKARKKSSRKPEYTVNLPKWVAYLMVAILILGSIGQFFLK